MQLISIKFNVESPEVITAKYGRSTVKRKGGLELIQFAKGLGPCGRYVHLLSAEIDFATVRIQQVSYAADMEPLLAKHLELQKEIGLVAMGGSGTKWGKALARSQEIEAFLEPSRKVETFVYQLGDVRGRIHAVEWRARQYTL